MLLPQPSDAIHKAWLYRVLSGIADNTQLSSLLRFKGGTCAAMRNLVDRFSVDLDFDLIDHEKVANVREWLKEIFQELGLVIEDESKVVPQFFLKYPQSGKSRNTLRVEVTFPPPKANQYEPVRFIEIDRILHCQTVETMFANKLVALIDRYEKHKSIAGRDIFDIHAFFLQGLKFNEDVIRERRNQDLPVFFAKISEFIEKKVTQQIIDEDLNYLLPPEQFKKTRKFLKNEVLMFLKRFEVT